MKCKRVLLLTNWIEEKLAHFGNGFAHFKLDGHDDFVDSGFNELRQCRSAALDE